MQANATKGARTERTENMRQNLFWRSLCRWCAGAAALAGALSLSGCLTFQIGEGSVFVPRPAPKAATLADMRVLGEEGFERVGAGARPPMVSDPVQFRAPDGAVLTARIAHDFLTDPASGLRLGTTFISVETKGRPLIVHCSGNAGLRYDDAVGYAAKALPFGDVLQFDYPGYGDSSGIARAADFEAATQLMAADAAARAADGRPLIFWGHSLGGFVCARMAASVATTDAMIFETSARNADEVATRWRPWFLPMVNFVPAPGLAGYDNATVLRDFAGPVLVMAAGRDRTLPPDLAAALAEALQAQGNKVTYVYFAEADHLGVPYAPAFRGVISDFLKAFAVPLERQRSN